jgi:hypothetical protein
MIFTEFLSRSCEKLPRRGPFWGDIDLDLTTLAPQNNGPLLALSSCLSLSAKYPAS